MNRIVKLEKMDFHYWIGELPKLPINDENERIIEIINSDNALEYNMQIALELSLHRHASSYAMLGFEYIPVQNSKKLMVTIEYSNKSQINYFSEIKSKASCKYIYCGLNKFLLPAVENSIIDFSKRHVLPAGYLNFKIAANCEVGSSLLIFDNITKILLTAFIDIDQKKIMKAKYCEKLFTDTILKSDLFISKV